MIVKFTISHLEKIIAALKISAEEAHNAAVSLYPFTEYQYLDSKSITLHRAQLMLSNTLDNKYLEMGVNVMDHDIQYMNARIKELENFYQIADDRDGEDIAKSISELHKNLLSLRKNYTNSLSTTFEVDLPDEIAECLNGIY